MRIEDDGLFAFLLRYSAIAAVPGMWFAYIGGVSPWWGAATGLTVVFLVGLPARLIRRRAGTGARRHGEQGWNE